MADVAKEVQLRAERKAGQFLIEMKERGELGPGIKSFTLKDFRFDAHESHRWRRIARLDDQAVADFIGPHAFALQEDGREDRDSGDHLLITNRFWPAGAPLRTFRLLLLGQVPNNREP